MTALPWACSWIGKAEARAAKTRELTKRRERIGFEICILKGWRVLRMEMKLNEKKNRIWKKGIASYRERSERRELKRWKAENGRTRLRKKEQEEVRVRIVLPFKKILRDFYHGVHVLEEELTLLTFEGVRTVSLSAASLSGAAEVRYLSATKFKNLTTFPKSKGRNPTTTCGSDWGEHDPLLQSLKTWTATKLSMQSGMRGFSWRN